MALDPNYFEDTSVHYYIPQPSGRENLLYYPISIGYFDCKPSYNLQRNVFSSFLLIVMQSGTLSYQTRQSRGVARAGNVLLLDCNAPHAYSALGKCAFSFVHFAGAQSRELYEEIVSQGGNLLQIPHSDALHGSITGMLASLRDAQRLQEAPTSAKLYSMFMTLLEHSGASIAGRGGNPTVDQAIAYIQSHLTDKLNVDEIAASAGYSASYFSHMFTEETGMSPYQFVVRSRIEQAQQLLKTTRLSIQEIAFQCGFNSAANFCYTFRRMTGLPPHDYRKRPL